MRNSINLIKALEKNLNAEFEQATKEFNNAEFVWSATNKLVLELETEYLDDKSVGEKLDKAYIEDKQAREVYEEKHYTYERLKDATMALSKLIHSYCDAMELDESYI